MGVSFHSLIINTSCHVVNLPAEELLLKKKAGVGEREKKLGWGKGEKRSCDLLMMHQRNWTGFACGVEIKRESWVCVAGPEQCVSGC